MATEYCLVCAAHGRKVAAVRIDYPQGDRVDYKCPVCPHSTTLVSETDAVLVLSLYGKEISSLLDDIAFRREYTEKVTNSRERKKLKERLHKLLAPMKISIKKRNPYDMSDLTRLVRTLGVDNLDHENYPEVMELVNELLRLHQKENDNV